MDAYSVRSHMAILNGILASIAEGEDDEFPGDFPGPVFAGAYVAKRGADAAKLLSEMHWEESGLEGVLRCKIYGHSILWDMKGNALHAGHTDYEIRPKGTTEEHPGNLQQILTFILRRNW